MALTQRSGSSFIVGDGTWTDGAVLTNPADGTVIVDTGPLAAGAYIIQVVGTGSVAWIYDLQHRNAANGANVHTQRRRPSAGNEDLALTVKFSLAANERVRCLLSGAITGEVQMSLLRLEVEA